MASTKHFSIDLIFCSKSHKSLATRNWSSLWGSSLLNHNEKSKICSHSRQHDINPIRESSPLGNYHQILWHALQFVSCSCDVGFDWKLVHDDFPHINSYSRRTWNRHLVWYSEKKAFHGATHCSERETAQVPTLSSSVFHGPRLCTVISSIFSYLNYSSIYPSNYCLCLCTTFI